jgi:hypothetical protein
LAEGFKLLDAYVEVTASGHGLADKVAGDIQRESSGSRGLGRVGSGMGGNLLGGLKGAFTSGAVGGLVGGVVGGVASGLTSIIGSAVSDIGSMLATVGGQVASTVIDFNSQLQNSTIGFETMLGSSVKAKSFMDDLQNFAKTTPFEFTSLVSNAQLMMGMGIAAQERHSRPHGARRLGGGHGRLGRSGQFGHPRLLPNGVQGDLRHGQYDPAPPGRRPVGAEGSGGVVPRHDRQDDREHFRRQGPGVRRPPPPRQGHRAVARRPPPRSAG